MKTLHRSLKGGFTLVELMVVIAIIAILTGIIITNLVGSKAKARDAQRASDLSQISLALEQFFDRCDQYPIPDTSGAGNQIDNNMLTQGSGVCPANVTFGNFISTIPTDPSTGAPYDYVVNDPSQPTDYVLYTTFETTNSVLSQSAPNPSWYLGPNSTPGDFDCSNQATTFSGASDTGLDYCIRPN